MSATSQYALIPDIRLLSSHLPTLLAVAYVVKTIPLRALAKRRAAAAAAAAPKEQEQAHEVQSYHTGDSVTDRLYSDREHEA
jgi:hypothetical protein